MVDFKITDFSHKGYSRLLLVEGDDDIDFMFSLIGELGLRDKIWLHAVGGYNKFQKELVALIHSAEFQDLEYLAIVRDADYNTNALNSIQTHLKNANSRHARHQFPIPQVEIQPTGDDDLKVSVMILPQAGIDGMLESIVLDALAEDDIMDCVNNYFKCLQGKSIELKENVLPKAKVRTLLAGKAVVASATHNESQIWEMRHMFKMSWWSWEHSAFDRLKTFLRQLAQ